MRMLAQSHGAQTWRYARYDDLTFTLVHVKSSGSLWKRLIYYGNYEILSPAEPIIGAKEKYYSTANVCAELNRLRVH